MPRKIRIDHYLKEKFFLEDKLIESYLIQGLIKVNQNQITKKNFYVSSTDMVEIDIPSPYPSRAAYKLLNALEKLNLLHFPKNKICFDIGCAHGGFSKVLLDNGAKKLYAIDVAKGIFDYSLRKSEKVVLFEEKNIKDIKIEDFDVHDFYDTPWFISCDVSFISLITVLKTLLEFDKQIKKINSNFSFHGIFLLKPQFEASKQTEKGIIKDTKLREEIIQSALQKILEMNYIIHSHFPASLKGTKGNLEEIVYLSLP